MSESALHEQRSAKYAMQLGGAPTLAKHVQHDKNQIGGKFCYKIRLIWDPIVCILILQPPELGDTTSIKHQKKLVIQSSDFFRHHQGVIEEGPTIDALLSCLTFKP